MAELSLCTKDSFDEILEKYSSMVYRLAFSRVRNTHDADDLTQEVFLKYIRADKTYNDEEHRKAWLIKTTINSSKTLLLSAWNRRRSGDEIDENQSGGQSDKILEQIETKSVVYRAVMELPQKYRTVVHLFYFEDMQVQAVSAVTGQTVNTVKSQLHRARALLKDKLKGVQFDDFDV